MLTAQPISTTSIILANAEIRDEFIATGATMLRKGVSAADVAEYIARQVEDDPDENSVGYGGLPNILGEVELDASFMDGASLKAGAVAGLKDVRHPISVARQVMERLPHVLLAGEGANRFADEIGAERRPMLSPAAERDWLDKLRSIGVLDEVLRGSNSVPDLRTLVVNRLLDVIGAANKALRDKQGSDTMNVIVRDAAGNIFSAVTTSGIAWKYPGRVGDSPVIGAGNYADNRYGAAACMGLGEITIRLGSSVRAITRLSCGQPLNEAGEATIREMLPIIGRSLAEKGMQRTDWVRLLLMDNVGNVGGFATRAGLSFKTQRLDEDKPRSMEAILVN